MIDGAPTGLARFHAVGWCQAFFTPPLWARHPPAASSASQRSTSPG
jgi:hypothetical protein